ncbi:MAG: DNA primase [Bdellovibrionota bacterium]
MSFSNLKDRIKESPISLVISQFIPLKRSGSSLVGLCPFHADSKPSMTVTDSKGLFKCFACGAGGDHIRFVMDHNKIEFIEALKVCAQILGLPYDELNKETKKDPKVEMAVRVLNASLKIYAKVADAKPDAYVKFIENRKLNQESIDKFHIGYSPGNNAFFHYLDKIQGADGDFARKVAMEIGIVRYNEDRDSYYDFYRDRVMFPIHDHGGQVRGYSSRAVLPDQKPKYLNSGESFAFDKKAILFGFYFAKTAIRNNDRAILVEGNMDVIMMHQFGFNETVATMGTTLAEQSVRLLTNMTKNIYFGMDNDLAGKKAMQKYNADFLAMGVLPKLLSFAPSKDPDEFLLAEGRLALMERIEKAPILLDTLIAEVIPEKIAENTEVKLNALQRVFELVSPLKEHLSATERIVEAAKTLGLRSDSGTILEDYKTYLSRQKEKVHAPKVVAPTVEEKEILLETEAQAQNLQVQKKSQEPVPLTKSERLFLREILCHPEFLTHLNENEVLALIGHDEVKKLVQWLVKIYREIDDSEYVAFIKDHILYGNYSKEIIEVGTDALQAHGNRLNDKVIERLLKDYKKALQMDLLKAKRKILVERQKSEPSQTEIDLILSEISKLDKEMLNLKDSP